MKIETHGDVAVVRLEAGKANAMNTALLDGIDALLDEVEASDARAVVLTGYDRFFCAGLDLVSLSKLDRAGMDAFMRHFERVMPRIFFLPLPVVAAVNGHAVAGGCVLALQADLRVMAAGAKMGLNEIALGVGLPPSVVVSLQHRVGPHAAFEIVMTGQLYDAEIAHEKDLVDEVAPPDQVLERSIELAQLLAGKPGPAYRHTKAGLRAEARRRLEASGEEPLETWLDTWFSDESQELVAAAVAQLTKKG